jgi:O-antigen biosynthesis protein WbqP
LKPFGESTALLKRAVDITLSLIGLVTLLPVILIVAVAIRVSSAGQSIYWSQRVGRNNDLFWMPKFRTMRLDTPAVATHLLDDPNRHLISIGSFLRKSSLDEIPQLWCVLTGRMSLVGPRPALFNQDDLISQRTACNVHSLTPGLTGWAQVNGRDEISIEDKVALDLEYLERQSFILDLKIIAMTASRVIGASGVRH